MPSSKIPETAEKLNSNGAVSTANDVEDTDDFVFVSPGDYPEASATSSTAAKDVWTKVIKITRTEGSLFGRVSTTLLGR